ncbi:MAG TPA: hypothetical protein VFW25_04295 [Silvibacterium sp.]|nr:hypothetical protein [Silvibacterium sp.]
MSRVIPFGEDPYDSIGSFACIAAALLSFLSLYRAFRPYKNGGPTTEQILFLIRSLEAVVLAAFIMVAADGIAMARHLGMWIDSAARYKLVCLLLGVIVAAALAQLALRPSVRNLPPAPRAIRLRAAVASCAGAFILAVYPESWIKDTGPHLITIAVGGVVLFATMRVFLLALTPRAMDRTRSGKQVAHRSGIWGRWSIVILLGAFVGLAAFTGEIAGSDLPPISRLFFVGSLFTCTGIAGIAIAYAFLGSPLGLAGVSDVDRSRSESQR